MVISVTKEEIILLTMSLRICTIQGVSWNKIEIQHRLLLSYLWIQCKVKPWLNQWKHIIKDNRDDFENNVKDNRDDFEKYISNNYNYIPLLLLRWKDDYHIPLLLPDDDNWKDDYHIPLLLLRIIEMILKSIFHTIIITLIQ